MYKVITYEDGTSSIARETQRVGVQILKDEVAIKDIEETKLLPNTPIAEVMQAAVDKLTQKVDNETKEPIEPVNEDSK